MPRDQKTFRAPLLVALLVLASIALRGWLAYTYSGFQTGDDLEIAEQAAHRALGLVHSPWNIRSLLIPDLLVAPVLKLAHLAGVRDSLALATIARIPFVVLSSLNILLLFLLGRRWYDDLTALLAAALYAVHWMPIVYGSSLYPRTVAVTCILGAAILLARNATFARASLAGLLAALAVTARYSEALFFLALLIVVAEQRKALAGLCAGFGTGFVLFTGLYDRLTWGRWFGSFLEFSELTFIRRDASSLVVSQPPWWYLGNLPHWMPLALIPLLVVAVRRGEARRFVAFVVLPVLALSAVFHKELRYLQVAVPFVLLFGARGFALWQASGRRKLALALLVLAFPLAAGRAGGVARRSTNAVAAALWLDAQQPRAVALSQPWAYGGRLFLGNDVAITGLDNPPRKEHLREVAPRVSAVALYESEVDAEIRALLANRRTRTFDGRGGRAVTVFYDPAR